MSQTHPNTAQNINSSRPSTMHNSQEADHNASATTETISPQAPLSPHWEKLTTSDGRTFYANHATRSTSWRRADAETGGEVDVPNIEEGLPPAWQALVDSDGKTYYANHETRTTTFVKPGGFTGELPAGWELLRNPEGVAYFADHKTHTMTWRDPRGDGFEGNDVEVVEARNRV